MENSLFDSGNPLVRIIAICAVVSALVGGVFGYYAASLGGVSGNSGSILPAIHQTSESDVVSNIVKNYSPSVVSIVASKNVTIQQPQAYNPYQDFCNDPFFQQFFGNCDTQIPQPQAPRTQKQDVAAGSGFIVSPDGLIATNKHVVDVSGASYRVILSNGKEYPATIVAKDSVQDIAIVKITATGLPTANLGNSDNIKVGETVLAIGNALGQFSNTVSKGIVSGLYRNITASEGNSSEQLDRVIQTDAAINPGNSGGPLIDLNGQVIGMNTAIASDAQSVGFALPINRVKKDINDVQASGKISYPFVGVQYELVDPQIQADNKLSVDHGALVIKGSDGSPAVVAGSPAAKAGLKEKDVILSVDGTAIDQKTSLADIIETKHPGDTVSLVINRGGQEITITAVLAEKK